MICFKCNGEEFATRTAVVPQLVRNEELAVETPVSVCCSCGWQTLARGQTDELRKRAADAYRRKHGLLTSAEIVSRRAGLEMSQAEFATYLRVGEASIKRWETWQIQDASSDELIRIKTDFAFRLAGQALMAVSPGQLTTSVRTRVSPSNEFKLEVPPPGAIQPWGEFSLFKCRQIMPGGFSGRNHSSSEEEIDYDANPNLTAAA
jgi:putative zinc finger/helix-turn-helix YgiT family protein